MPAVALLGTGAGLDATLAALEQQSRPRSRVLLCLPLGPADTAVLESWQSRSGLHVERVELPPEASPAIRLAALVDAAGCDVVVLAPGCVPAPGALAALIDALAGGNDVASATPWSNDGELCSFPRLGERNPPPEDLAEAAARVAACPERPDIPLGGCHAVALRFDALREAGGIDCETFASAYAALVDLFLRQRAGGRRHLLAGSAFVVAGGEQGPGMDDLRQLNARYPGYGAQVATFLMQDPLRALRGSLVARPRAPSAQARAQGDLFG